MTEQDHNNMDFPRNFADLDRNLTLDCYDVMLPYAKGYDDAKYRSFRQTCVTLTKMYKLGTPIPSPNYPQYQVETWTKAFTRLMELYPTHACSKFNSLLAPFLDACCISADEVPDIEKISTYLMRKTGFRLRPVSTFISPRDFLDALAFRVFTCAQYVRPADAVFFTNEPDIVHEILGHAVLLCDPKVADFSQEVGLASLGAPDHVLDKIASVYMSTIEAGLCWEGGRVKAYGAVVLSGSDELQHALTDEAVRRPLAMELASLADLDLNKYRDEYFVSSSIDEAIDMTSAYLRTLPNLLPLKYDPDTNSVELQE